VTTLFPKILVSFVGLLLSHAMLAAAPGAASVGPDKPHAIYRCKLAGVSTFSDSPCGDSVEQYGAGLDRISILDSPVVAVPTARRSPRPVPVDRGAKAEASAEVAQATRLASCRRSQQALHKIRTQMRTGYSAKQGERLRVRKQELEGQRQALGC
jgi:hypothetical protein